MKIHGQDFRDIFKKLPWQYQGLVVAAGAFILFTLIYVPSMFIGRMQAPPAPEPLQMLQGEVNIFDPALAQDATGTVWLAYTMGESVAGDVMMHVRTARANNKACKTWMLVDDGFNGKRDDLIAPDGQSVFRSGTWRIETPAIVHDPDDKGREWKLYAYKYFWPNDPDQALAVAQHYGMIVYKFSSDPSKGWSDEQWLFSPGVDYPPSPYDQMVPIKLNALDKTLHDIAAYARPSVIYQDGILVMSLSAFTKGSATPDRIVMLGSKDHGRSWVYLGTPLHVADVKELGPYTILGGATLIRQDGRIVLSAVLGDDKRRGQGAFIFGFEDVGTGLLRRKNNVPELIRTIPLNVQEPGILGGGFAAYTDACPFGVLTGEQGRGGASFQIFKTYQKPLTH